MPKLNVLAIQRISAEDRAKIEAVTNSSIARDARNDVANKLASASSGWNVVAVGTAGRPGLGLKATNEANAVSDALADCAKHDSDCHVIAVGPFTVQPN